MRIELQPAFVLHTKAYRDTSLIVELFSEDYGRLAVVAKGARGRKGKSAKPRLVPFQPMVISCLGNGELKTLTGYETSGVPLFLSGKNLYSALYLNEMIIRLLPPMDAHAEVYLAYAQSLRALADVEEASIEPVLRQFELGLLEELGYAPSFDTDAMSGESIVPERCYCYIPEAGFVSFDPQEHPHSATFRGGDLLAIGSLDFSADSSRRAAKQFTRMALHPLLGNKPLQSRALFS